MAITYVPEPEIIPSPRLLNKAAKDKFFNVDQSSRSNSIASVHDEVAGGSTTSSFEEIRRATAGEGADSIDQDIIEKKDLKAIFAKEFSDVVRAAVAAAAAKAVAATAARNGDGLASNASTLTRANSVPKPPRHSFEFDKNAELRPLLEKPVTPPPLPVSPIPKTDKVLEFAKSNVD